VTTTTHQLMGLAVTALRAASTGAGDRVYGPRDWPTWRGQYPVVLVQMPREDKEGMGRNGAPQFTVTGTLRITGRVAALGAPDDAGAGAALSAAAVLARQIEIALINASTIMPLLQQIPFVRTEIALRASGKQHLVEATIEIGLEFYQGADDFAQPELTDLEQVSIYTDLTNVFDPTGTYADPPFPGSVVPAPRTVGPDGRTEGAGLNFTNLQS
jgi:hypothetical protein